VDIIKDIDIDDIEIDAAGTLDLLRELIEIESINPVLVPGGSGEERIARRIGRTMADMGLEVRYQPIGPGRANVVGIMRGAGGGQSLMLNGHTDTVGGSGVADAAGPVLRGGRVYGRGSLDMKGGLAAMLAAALALSRSRTRLGGDLILACVADEEHASRGTELLVREYKSDAAVVCEPTGLKICLAHKGFAWIGVDVAGRAAHGSLPDEGIDAIVNAGWFLVEVERLSKEVLAAKSHPLLTPPSLHASLIKGGSELSTYPAHCRIDLERRTIPGETEATVAAEMETLLSRAKERCPSFAAKFAIDFYRPPLEVKADQPIVARIAEAWAAVTGAPPQFTGMSCWMDAAILAASGIPAVIFGPDGAGAHAQEEYVDFASIITAAKVLAATARAFCGYL